MATSLTTLQSGSTALRRGLLVGITLVMLTIAYSLMRYPAINDGKAGTIIFAIIVIVLSAFYAFAAVQWTKVNIFTAQWVIRQSSIIGLICGGLWIVELVTGNLLDTSSFAVLLFYRGSTVAVPIVTFAAALFGARRNGRTQTGLQIGFWSGLISGLITCLSLMFITYVFMSTLRADPQTLQEFARNGAANLDTSIVTENLVGAINHLWIGPLLGIILGSVGGFVGAQSKSHS